jgi:imidazolonepropionase-like amidohydrolase
MTACLIDNGTLLDSTGRPPVANTSVYVDGNVIAKIGPTEELRAFARSNGSYERIDATAHTIMPGLIDCHVHPSYGDITSIEQLDIYTSREYRTLRGALACKKVLRAGVTAMCCPGGNWNINAALRDAVNAGLIEGPRMVAAARYIATWNATGSSFPSHMQHPPSSFVGIFNTRDEMIAEVRKEIKDGNDLIKVSGDGDTSGTTGFGVSGSITLDDLKAIAEVTHLAGKRCTIHARSGEKAAAAAIAGFDWIIHASFMNDEQLGVIIEHQTPINPTLSLLVNGIEWGPELGQPQAITDAFKREIEAASKILSKAHKEGVMLMAGTDSGQLGVPYGAWHARELEHMMNYLGMSSMEAIRAGTINSAFTLGMQNRIGTVEAGKLADILVVDGDPLTDIQVLQDPLRLKAILKDGVVVDTKTPLPEPVRQSWEFPLVIWSDPRLPTIDYVREFATSKPAWLRAGAHTRDL